MNMHPTGRPLAHVEAMSEGKQRIRLADFTSCEAP